MREHEPALLDSLENPWEARKTAYLGETVSSSFTQTEVPNVSWPSKEKDPVHVRRQLASARPSYLSLVTKDYFLYKGSTDPAYHFRAEDYAFLKEWGYDMEDVRLWRSAVTNPDVDMAIDTLYQALLEQNKTPPIKGKPAFVPIVIVSLLLRRRSLTSVALQRLLVLTWTILRQDQASGINTDDQIFLLFARFQRHLRRVWPQGLVNAAAFLVTFTPTVTWKKEGPLPNRQSNLNEYYNKAIELLSQATRIRSFLSYIYCEKAQFVILNKMSQLEPYLSISSRAYASLVKVQLANRQTPVEEDWVSLLSRSYPPVPEPKTRMDEHKDFEYGASRAVRTIQHMHMAGFSNPEWERVAMIYAGWEADGSVSIQTRKIIKSFPTIVDNPEAALGAARVDVARDIREAWYAFLQYEGNHPPHIWVYFAVFRKLASEHQRLQARESRHIPVTPGSRELSSPASSSMQRLYLPSEPPNFMQLYQRMKSSGVVPRGQLLGFLMSNSPSLEDTIEIWRHATGQTFHDNFIDSVRMTDGSVHLDESSFAGLVDVLCRHPFGSGARSYLNRAQLLEMKQSFKDLISIIPTPFLQKQLGVTSLIQALIFTMWRKDADMRIWMALIRSTLDICQQPLFVGQSFSFFPFVLKIMDIMSQFGQRMEPEFFGLVSRFGEVAIRSARLHVRHSIKQSAQGATTLKEAKFVLEKAPILLRSIFANLTSSAVSTEMLKQAIGDLDVVAIPASLTLFTTYDCLRYVRALIAASDYEGLYSWCRWLVAHEAEMEMSAKEQVGGLSRFEYTLGMIRLSLEQPWILLSANADEDLALAPSEELQELIKNELEKLKVLPAWMSDADLEEFKTLKLIH